MPVKRKIIRAAGLLLALSMLPMGTAPAAQKLMPAYAAAQTITSMAYFSENDGPVITGSGVKNASYGFVMPVFNSGSASLEDVSADISVCIKIGEKWQDIGSVSGFAYDHNWGIWQDGGFSGYWFTVSETTEIRLCSKADPSVYLDYKLVFTKLSSESIKSMKPTQGPDLTAGATGGSGFTYPEFNGDPSIKYDQVADDMRVYVKTASDADWIDIDNNAASGWIYDKNFGQFTDGGGGWWFTVTETTYVRLASKTDPTVYVDYTIKYEKPVRTSHTVTAAGDTTLTADKKGAIGLVLPNIDGGSPISDELDLFVYEVLVDGKWIPLTDSKSGFSYRSKGYSRIDPATQWGYWADGVYGLWFQPVTEDCTIRIGYPTDGKKGEDCGGNYVEYRLIGNPDAPRPDPIDAEPIELGTAETVDIDGWELIWNDEFEGSSLDRDKWTNETGYFIDDDPGTWGWGNNELEYYTDSEKNTFIKDGRLTLRLLDEPASFEQDPSRIAPYSSGKVISRDKFSFKYGRIDFCAKLPVGTGLWPALWMLPNESVYGTWASSGEIDVMESKGRIPDTVYGTIHYGGSWPANTYSGTEYTFDEGTYDDGFHVYSCVWEKERIKWYVDGKCYQVIPYTEWYSAGAADNPYAPFDEEFYIIMNLAAGGNFDGGVAPAAQSVPADMQVEYVRVYQPTGDTSGTFTDNSANGSINMAFLVRLSNHLLGKTADTAGLDLDKNGKIDTFDLILARKMAVEHHK